MNKEDRQKRKRLKFKKIIRPLNMADKNYIYQHKKDTGKSEI